MYPGGNVSPALFSPGCRSRPANSEYDTRSVTRVPLTCSAGQVAHQAMNCDSSPRSVRMFHSALTRRKRLDMGTLRPVSGSTSRKSMMPCSSGALPVATVVHSSGESMGVLERRSARTPRRSSPARAGSRPAFSSGSITCQSAPSRPMIITLRSCGRIRARARCRRRRRRFSVSDSSRTTSETTLPSADRSRATDSACSVIISDSNGSACGCSLSTRAADCAAATPR